MIVVNIHELPCGAFADLAMIVFLITDMSGNADNLNNDTMVAIVAFTSAAAEILC